MGFGLANIPQSPGGQSTRQANLLQGRSIPSSEFMSYSPGKMSSADTVLNILFWISPITLRATLLSGDHAENIAEEMIQIEPSRMWSNSSPLSCRKGLRPDLAIAGPLLHRVILHLGYFLYH